MFDELRAEFTRNHSEMPRDFDHALIFFTAGALARQELKKTDPAYVPYADRLGIYKRVPYWSEDEAAFQSYWEPYLEGKEPRQKALSELVKAICCTESQEKDTR